MKVEIGQIVHVDQKYGTEPFDGVVTFLRGDACEVRNAAGEDIAVGIHACSPLVCSACGGQLEEPPRAPGKRCVHCDDRKCYSCCPQPSDAHGTCGTCCEEIDPDEPHRCPDKAQIDDPPAALRTLATPPSKEVEILQGALTYWTTKGTDEEAQESGELTAAAIAQSVRDELRQYGPPPGAPCEHGNVEPTPLCGCWDEP